MNGYDLLKELQRKFSLNKACSIVQMATELGVYESCYVKITAKRLSDSNVFTLEWKR